ncbi:MAG: patatin-like phospholipase family protein [Neisseriaceae bacterium]
MTIKKPNKANIKETILDHQKLEELFSTPSAAREIIYVFQGGGALGAFQVGAVNALSEHGYSPDMLVGISIGAINASIVAGNKPEDRINRLNQFWDTITTTVPFPMMKNLGLAKIHNSISANYSMLLGQPGFFKPRAYNPWLLPDTTVDQLSFYDTAPLKDTLEQLIDFDYLNKNGPRICLGAVDLESGEFEFFDSKLIKIGPEHIMASCALPPGFPPIKIDDRYYIDGGVFSNTPLSKVIDEFADSDNEIKNVLCFMVDLFSSSGILPHSMDGIMERIKDIQYSSHSKRNNSFYATTQNLSHAIHFLSNKLSEDALKDAQVQEVLKLGFAHRMDIIRIIYHSEKGTELHSKDYEFSKESANIHRQSGYKQTKLLIKEQEASWQKKHQSGVTVYKIEANKTSEHKV